MLQISTGARNLSQRDAQNVRQIMYFYSPVSQFDARVKNIIILPVTSAPMSFVLIFHPLAVSFVSWRK